MDTPLAVLDYLNSVDLLPDFFSARGIFCGIAWLATFLSLGLLFISFVADAFGGGSDGGDIGADGDTGTFSIRACMGFVLGFGWGGYCATQAGLGAIGASLVGIAVGLVMFFIVAAVMKFIYGLRSDGTLDYSTLTGCTGSVYVTVPPHGEPGGQVQITHPSQLITIAAVQEGDSPLPAQTRVIVTAATSGQVTVKAL